jgi:hypothetical protein
MTQDEITTLIETNELNLHGDIEHFAALVAAHEREECAKLFETITKDTAVPPVHFSLADTAKLIRARSNT